jgi:anti-sigma28 factor (negative regulator of flagellin synthesis)
MNGPAFNKAIQPNIAGSNVHDNVEHKNPERQQKLADLKTRIQSGEYKVDISNLAKQIQESSALDNE